MHTTASTSAMRLAPLTAETCCVVANYYSMRGKHDRSILYFQRALKLNPKCISAWTLMGHEFVELRNPAASVQCYRKALEVSSGGDHRAWYGLGTTYEMLHMFQYALYYFKSAAALRPGDGRMWCGVGSCLYRLGAKPEAMKAFERAVAAGDREGVATHELARLYRESGQSARAAECYYQYILLTGGPGLVAAVQAAVQSGPDSDGQLSGGAMNSLISGTDEVGYIPCALCCMCTRLHTFACICKSAFTHYLFSRQDRNPQYIETNTVLVLRMSMQSVPRLSYS
jgi:Flp pilus assembly protein TadD